MQTRTTIERRITGTERRHGSWLTDRQRVESVEEEKRIFVKSFWQMENGKWKIDTATDRSECECECE